MTIVLASTNRVQLSYIPEADFGVIPVSGTQKNLRTTGETFDANRTKESDKEINANADLTSSTTTNAATGGDLKVHFQYGEYDPFLAGVMRTTWSVYGTNGVGTTFTADFTATTMTAAVAPTGANAFTTLQKGQWFRVNAPTSPNDGRLVRVSTTTAPTSTIVTVDANTPFSVGTAVASCTVATSRLANGVTLQSFSLQRAAGDVVQYFAFRGMYVTKFATNFASAQLTEGTFSFIGKNVAQGGTNYMPAAEASATPSLAYDIQNGVTNVGQLWEGGVPLTTTFIKSMSLEIDSGLRAQDAIGNLGMIGAGIGTFTAKGTVDLYFADGTIYNKFSNDTYTSFILSSVDALGNGYVFTFPKVQLTTAKIQAGAKDQDLMATFEYTAYRDLNNAVPALRKALFIDRVGAAVLP